MSHIFISYSTQNADYAYKLAEKLQDEGFNIWIDNKKLRSSDNWWESIVKALRVADAFVVIMTPESRKSRWVQREVTLADNWGKQAFPILLDGDNFEIYVLTQYLSTRDERLPSEEFFDDLARFSTRSKTRGTNLIGKTQNISFDDSAVQEAIANPPENDNLSISSLVQQFISPIVAILVLIIFLTILNVFFNMSGQSSNSDIGLETIPESSLSSEIVADLSPLGQVIETSIPTDLPLLIPENRIIENETPYIEIDEGSSSFFIAEYLTTASEFTTFLNNRSEPLSRMDSDNEPMFDTDSDSRNFIYTSVWIAILGRNSDPVIGVTWYGAKAFCNSISARLATPQELSLALSFGYLKNAETVINEAIYEWSQNSITNNIVNRVSGTWNNNQVSNITQQPTNPTFSSSNTSFRCVL